MLENNAALVCLTHGNFRDLPRCLHRTPLRLVPTLGAAASLAAQVRVHSWHHTAQHSLPALCQHPVSNYCPSTIWALSSGCGKGRTHHLHLMLPAR
jgi:hypothetical protein